jgi:hypothetical protein
MRLFETVENVVGLLFIVAVAIIIGYFAALARLFRLIF